MQYSNSQVSRKTMLQEVLGFIRQYPVTGCLIVLNALCFLASDLTGGSQNVSHMISCGAAYGPLILDGEYYRLFTCMFLHFGMQHLVNNMLTLGVLGTRLEMVVGRVRFLLIYLMGGLAGNLVSLYVNVRKGAAPVSAGASGAVFAVLGCLICVIVYHKGRAQGITLRQILIMAVLSTYTGFASQGVDNTAHLAGLAAGFLLGVIVYGAPTHLKRKKKRPDPFV